MNNFIISGPSKLKGEIKVLGAKNAALKAIPAALLSKETLTLKKVPVIEDIKIALKLIKKLGATVRQTQEHELTINTSKISSSELDEELTPKLRPATLFIGPLLLRTKRAVLPHPGGCAIGERPIDLFIKGFQALGATVNQDKNGNYQFEAKKLHGANFVFPQISHTATEALMITASLIEGETTTLINCACEPEVEALATYLNSQGAYIEGAGTHTITIKGVKEISAGTYEMIPDRIEAGTFTILGVLTNSTLKITDCEPRHLDTFLNSLKETGALFEVGKDYILTKPSRKPLRAVDLKTQEYPGFPTDLQAPFVVLLTQCEKNSLIHETIFDGRLFYTDLLNKMGAKIIMCDPHRVIVEGPTPLFGGKVTSPDIRAGIALVLAGATSKKPTLIENIYQIKRGYENIASRLAAIGMKIKEE
jgi:UDP-N-acetylglucosamine 1-carboxyvinyltransferase